VLGLFALLAPLVVSLLLLVLVNAYAVFLGLVGSSAVRVVR
jgi:hypothetical protein